jgi:hypothetical protein
VKAAEPPRKHEAWKRAALPEKWRAPRSCATPQVPQERKFPEPDFSAIIFAIIFPAPVPTIDRPMWPIAGTGP